MRINKYIASSTGISRRAADAAIAEGRVTVNGIQPTSGHDVIDTDKVKLDGRHIRAERTMTVMLNKPVGYVVSRDGQGSQTIYDLIPKSLHNLKPVGRLDKDSSGLLLLTNDGNLANQLTHPSYRKSKKYQVELNKPLETSDRLQIEQGIELDDGPSKLLLRGDGQTWEVEMSEGRNRQIRRTFSRLNYDVIKLNRTVFGPYELGKLDIAKYIVL